MRKIAEMYQRIPATKIREEVGRSLYSLYKELRAEGVEIRPRGRRPVLENPGKEVIESKLAQGKSQMEVAQEYGVSKRTVQRWLGR